MHVVNGEVPIEALPWYVPPLTTESDVDMPPSLRDLKITASLAALALASQLYGLKTDQQSFETAGLVMEAPIGLFFMKEFLDFRRGLNVLNHFLKVNRAALTRVGPITPFIPIVLSQLR